MKTLVLGGSGFVGHYLVDHFNGIGTTSSDTKKEFTRLDITDKNEVEKTLEKIKPELIINSAAMADVDLCEKEKEKALLVNGYSVAWLAESSSRINAKFVQISTDYVFDGGKGDYREEDKPNPINQYGKSKLIGEENALKYQYLVLRIELPYGANLAKNKSTFFESVIKNLKENKSVSAARDQIISPTFVEDIPIAIEALINMGRKGVFHLASKENLSRYEFAQKIARVFELNEENVKPVSLDDFKFLAKRPKNTFLNVEKISKIIKINSLEQNLTKLKLNYEF